MNQEIKVGSKWVSGGENIVTIVYINSRHLCYEFDNDGLNCWRIEEFLDNFTPCIEPKPPLKVEAWQDQYTKQYEWYPAGHFFNDRLKREPRLDYEVE